MELRNDNLSEKSEFVYKQLMETQVQKTKLQTELGEVTSSAKLYKEKYELLTKEADLLKAELQKVKHIFI